jgi:hypothetical protein
VGFFEPPEGPEPGFAPFPEPSGWVEPPRNQLGGPVPLRLLLARTEDVAVMVLGGAAYGSGFEFALSIRLREGGSSDPSADDPFGPNASEGGSGRQGLPGELLRFGIELSDGRKATSLGVYGGEEEPPGPVLSPRGGHGGGGAWDVEYWLWPLPPPGPLAFVCEWPARGIALTRAEIDAAIVRDAAESAETLWPSPPGGGYGVRFHSRTARAGDETAGEGR